MAQNSLNLSEDLARLGIAPSNMVPNQPSLDSGPLLYQGVVFAIGHQIPLVIADTGTYYFSSLQNPSWHVQLEGLQNMTIDLQGSNLIFTHPLQNGLYIGYDNNATFQNFTADYQPLPFTQVTVAAVKPNSAQIQYSVPPGWQDPSCFNSAPSGTIIEVHVFRDGQPASGTRRMAAMLPIANDLITIIPYDTNPTPQNMSLIRPGDTAVVTMRFSGSAIVADRCVHCTFRNITVYSSSAAAIQAYFSTSITLERFYMIPKPGTDRLVSSLGINSLNPGPNSVIRLSRAIRSMDDGYGLFNWCTGIVQSQTSAQSLTVAGETVGNQTTLNWLVSVPNGTPVAFQSPSDGSLVASATVVSQVAGSTSADPYTVSYTFDRTLPAAVVGTFMYPADPNQRGAGSVIERSMAMNSGHCCNGFDIGGWASNSTVRGNYVHGVALSGFNGYQELQQSFGEPKSTPLASVTFSNNVIDGAIQTPTAALWWLGLGAMQMITLRTDPQNGDYNLMTASPHQNISIVNNFIADPGRSAVWIGNTAAGTIAGNHLWNPNNSADLPDAYQVYAGDASIPLVADPTSSGITIGTNPIDATSLRVFVTDTGYRELAAYSPGSTIRLSAYGVGLHSNLSVSFTDADGNSSPAPIQSTATHSLDVQIPPNAALGGAFLTLTTSSGQYLGTLFVDSQDNGPALNGCTYEISPSSSAVPPGTLTLPILVVTQSGCAYQPVDGDAFVSPGVGASGTSVTMVGFAANSGATRTTTIEIAGQPLVLKQGNTCDIGNYGTVGASDVQLMINQASGAAPAVSDLNKDGVVNVVDVQIVINASLNGGCSVV